MSCNCDNSNSCCDMIDELLESIQNGLGKVDYDKIDKYIDDKLNEFKEDLLNGDIEVSFDLDALLAQLKDLLASGDVKMDAYNVTYKDTTVGDELDKINDWINKTDPFCIKSNSTFTGYTIGEKIYNKPVYFSYNKKLKELTASVYVNDMNVTTVKLDVESTKYEIPYLSATTQVVIKAVSVDDEVSQVTITIPFYKKYYVGCNGGTNLTNKEVTALNSYLALPKVSEYSHIFHPIGKQYLWWAFPVELHMDYDFFNNGFLDSNYVWTTGNLTNEYGYTSEYIFIRSGNPHTSSNIYTEVKAHEHK